MFNALINKFKISLKENTHVLIGINLLLSLFIMFSDSSSQKVKLILVNSNNKKSDQKYLKEIICKKAFYSLRDNKVSKAYIHPDIIEFLKQSEDEDYNFKNINKLYFKFEGREICKVVAKTNTGYIAYVAVISTNGPLFFRVTSLEAKKPSFKEIKEYL